MSKHYSRVQCASADQEASNWKLDNWCEGTNPLRASILEYNSRYAFCGDRQQLGLITVIAAYNYDWKFGLWSREILDRVLDFWSVCYQQGAVMALTVEQDVLSIRSLLCARGIKICTITLGVHFSWRCWSSIVSVIICCWCLASIKEPPANQFQSQFLWMMGIIVAEAWRDLWEGSKFSWRCFGFYNPTHSYL